jgi:hypothetical protein
MGVSSRGDRARKHGARRDVKGGAIGVQRVIVRVRSDRQITMMSRSDDRRRTVK